MTVERFMVMFGNIINDTLKNKDLTTDEVCDLLNKLYKENQQLKKEKNND